MVSSFYKKVNSYTINSGYVKSKIACKIRIFCSKLFDKINKKLQNKEIVDKLNSPPN